MSSDVMVRVDNVSVRYGKQVVLEAVSFDVARGSVYALLGRNGAGKSSMIRCLLGLQKPAAGQVTLNGQNVWTHRARVLARTGYVPETFDAPSSLRVRDIVSFYRAVYPRWNSTAMTDRLKRFGLPEAAAVSTLSKGQKALFTLALALSNEPELLVLDDPTLGLDVVARNDFFSDFIGELADRGTTVILTTHDLAGVEGIADRVGILQGSSLAIDEDLERLKLDRGQSLEQVFLETTRRGGRVS
jgi:ABC-2 type transport system ATP-binding protein